MRLICLSVKIFKLTFSTAYLSHFKVISTYVNHGHWGRNEIRSKIWLVETANTIISSLFQSLVMRSITHAANLVLYALLSEKLPMGAYIDQLGRVHDLLETKNDFNGVEFSSTDMNSVLRCLQVLTCIS